ncbi:MAG: GNAT family N-acetyltransferase [Geminicoccaceae bacterium]
MTERKLIERIERAALWAWPPRETAHEDGWLLRAAGGHTRRVNSVQALVFAAGSDVARTIARVERWYAARDLPACFQLTELASPADLDQVLAARGYARLTPVSVLLVETAGVPAPARVELVLESRPTPLVMNAVCDPHWGPELRRERAALFSRIRRTHAFAVVLEGGQPVAGGLCVADGELAGIFTLRTAAPARGRGLATAVLRRLAAWARGHGARALYLQVEDGNAPSLALCRRHGASRAYGYWYRERPGPA